MLLYNFSKFEALDYYPRVSKQNKMEFDRLVLSPPPVLPLYRGRDIKLIEYNLELIKYNIFNIYN